MRKSSLMMGIIIIAIVLMAGIASADTSATGANITATTPYDESGAAVTIPLIYQVSVDVNRKDLASDPNITTTFLGGPGINFVSLLNVTVIRSDGTSETQGILKPKVDDQIIILGTTGTDRVVVQVKLADGNVYSIFDKKMPFRSIGSPSNPIEFKAPWEGSMKISQGYDSTYSHIEDYKQKYALDIFDPNGTRFYVLAAADGVVEKIQIIYNQATIDGKFRFGYVREVILNHTDKNGETLYTAYLHLNDIYVKTGEKVTQGQILGLSGNTGISDAIHLHFQLSKGGYKISTPIESLWMANSSGYYKNYNGELGELDDDKVSHKTFISDNIPTGDTISQLTPKSISPGAPVGQDIPKITTLKQKFEWEEAYYTYPWKNKNRKYLLFLNNTNDYPNTPVQIYQVTGNSKEIELEGGKIYRWNIAPDLPDWNTLINERLYSEKLMFQTVSEPNPDQVQLLINIRNGSSSGPSLKGVSISGTDGNGIAIKGLTDANGEASIDGVPGMWQITASKPGFTSKSWNKVILSATTYQDFLTQGSTEPSDAKLHTDAATNSTSTSATLHGHISGLKEGEEYPVCFRYEGGATGKTKVGHTTVSATSPDYEFTLTGLEPGTTYYYRAVHVDSQGVGDDEKHAIDADNTESFITSGSPVNPTYSEALNEFLESINSSIENQPAYFDSEWGISKDQYKIILAALAYAEGANFGYSAHSGFLSESGPDMYRHANAPLFYFSRGIGPFQIDILRGTWPTIKKLNSTEAIDLTLYEHKRLLPGPIGNIEDIRINVRNTWLAYYRSEEPHTVYKRTNYGNWAYQWETLTGTKWDDVKSSNKSSPLPFTWDEFKIKYQNKLASSWEPYGDVIKNIGKKQWIILSEDNVTTDKGTPVVINKELDTYLIKAKGIGKEWEYYYGQDDSTGIEIWAYYSPNEKEYHLKSIFWREYTAGAYPEQIIKKPGEIQKAGKTLGHEIIKVDDEPSLTNADVALIIDSSGSMADNDPKDLRKSAAKLFIDLVDNEDKIAIVDFDDSVRTWQSLISVVGNREILKTAVNKVDSYGSTNIGGGLRYGYNELNSGAADPLHQKAAILLTDGQHNTGTDPSSVVPDYITKGWSIYTIALSSGADKILLKKISSDTDGQYYDVPESKALQDIYNRISQNIKGSSQLDMQAGKIIQGQTLNGSMPIDSSVKALNLVLTWPGSDLDLVLYYPDGTKVPLNQSSPYGTDDPSISYIAQATYEIYKVQNPQPGAWHYDIIGVNVVGQEDYSLTLSAASDIRLNAYTDHLDYYPGSNVLITAELSDESGGLSGAQVTADITLPDLAEDMVVLSDTGGGKYSGIFSNTTQQGRYLVLVQAERQDVVRQKQMEFDTGTGTIPSPVANFTADNTYGVLPLTVQFNDTSKFSPTSWQWDFGDGSPQAVIPGPVHTYSTEGIYTVNLTVFNSGGMDTISKMGYIVVESPFYADFIANPIRGNPPLTVAFNDTSEGNPTEWAWDFGDGKSSNQQHPVHEYLMQGDYSVKLTIKTIKGDGTIKTNTTMRENYITVTRPTGPQVIAAFIATPLIGKAPFTVQFTDTSSGNPNYWVWKFGDRRRSVDKNPVHTFTVPGNYSVRLTVWKGGGGFKPLGDTIYLKKLITVTK